MSSFIKKLFGKQEATQETTMEEEIYQAQADVENAFNVFRDAQEQVVKANMNLAAVVASATAEKARLEKVLTQANIEIEKNNNLMQRLSEFIPTK
jgi:hypothetical protein